MSRATTTPATPAMRPVAELLVGLPSGATIVAVSDDGSDARYAPVRALAGQAAVRVGGTVLFCLAEGRDQPHLRSRPRLFFPPVDLGPGRPHTGTRRRDLLLAEARAIAAPGLTVGVWLPGRLGASGVAEAVSATRASLVLVAARGRRRAAVDRTLEYVAARVSAPVVSVRPDGSWERVSALGAGDDCWLERAGRLVRPVALSMPAR